MKVSAKTLLLLAAGLTIPAINSVEAQEKVPGRAFYGSPPDDSHPWAVHDRNRPQPKVVTAGTYSTQEKPGTPPGDAIILFDGTDLSKWKPAKKKDNNKEWIVVDGAMQCIPGSGYIRTIEEFGDCQLHIEWSAPAEVKGEGQGRGNSGVFLMGKTEIQVLDNHNNPSYPDGMAGSLYGVNPPMANALRAPGEWRVYDIVFRRPIFIDGKEVDPGYFTVFCNGVLLQDHTPLEGGGGHRGRSKSREFPAAGPLSLQDHGNPVRYRNIWYRPLPPRSIEGGTNGMISKEAAIAKRNETAANIREHAATLADATNPLAELNRTAESLTYEVQDAASARVLELANQYTSSLAALDAEALKVKKGEVLELEKNFDYLIKNQRLAQDFAPVAALRKIIAEQNWKPKKK